MKLAPNAAAEAIRGGTAPHGLSVAGSLSLRDATALTALPDGLTVTQRLDLSGCVSLEALPKSLRVGALVLRGCTQIEALPEGLVASFLDATDCTRLARWPSHATIEHGHVLLRNCRSLTELPSWLMRVARLDLSGCIGISAVPEGIEVASFIDIGGSSIRSLPKSLAGVELRWRGVRVDERVAFHPESIDPLEVLGEPNAERRRVLLERVGNERFLDAVSPEILDRDVDPGGPRKLLRVALNNDEPLVCLAVQCPSTARQYMLRVPPRTTTCRQAAAWIAGFDNPSDYAPIVET